MEEKSVHSATEKATSAAAATETTQRDIKLIAVDVDGTLLNNDHSLSDRNRQALLRAHDAGIAVVLATGKTRVGAESIIAALNLTTPGIYVQGIMVYNPDGSVRYQETLDPITIRRVITFAEQRGFDVLAYSGNRLMMKLVEDRHLVITRYHEPTPESVGPLVNHLETLPINKLLIFGAPRKLTALRWQLEKILDGQAGFTSTNVLDTLEILPPGASKGKALKVLIHEMGIAPAEVMAIGDGENDIEMVKLAGLGVAVANANPKLKAIADAVVSSNDEDGVAEAIERYVKLPATETPETSTSKSDKQGEDDA